VFVAECPALPGCISQGETRVDALANIKDAMTGYLASLKKRGEPTPSHHRARPVGTPYARLEREAS